MTGFNKAIMTMSESSTSYLDALNDYTQFTLEDFKDDMIYMQWKKAEKTGDPDADYLFSKLSEALQKDLQADTDQGELDKAYEERIGNIMQTMESSDSNYGIAQMQMEEAQKANEYGDGFTFATVLFTIVLFFAGMCSLAKSWNLKLAYIGAAGLMFIYSIIKFVTIPFPPLS